MLLLVEDNILLLPQYRQDNTIPQYGLSQGSMGGIQQASLLGICLYQLARVLFSDGFHKGSSLSGNMSSFGQFFLSPNPSPTLYWPDLEEIAGIFRV